MVSDHEHVHGHGGHAGRHDHDAHGATGHASAAHGGHGAHGAHDKHAGHDPAMFRRRFWICLALTIPLVVTSEMVMEWFGYDLDFPAIEWVGPILGTAVFAWGGWPFLAGAVLEVRQRQPGMMLLIAMAITVAYVASMATSLDAFELDFWWELAGLVTIMLLGHWQEMNTIGQAQGALSALAELLPDEAQRVEPDATVSTVRLEDLRPDDVVLVRPGARVPADGQMVEGEADIDESMITGESRPVTRGVGDRVVAGTVATDSAIRVRVVSVGDDTALAGIQRLVADAQSSSSRAQVLADRSAALLFYVAAAAGLVAFLVWWGLGHLDEAVVRTVSVLVVACPHALGLAIPLVIAISTAVSAKAGILVKDRLALERMRTVDTVLFDKTGTLTPAPMWSPASPVWMTCPTRRCSVWPVASRPTASTRLLERSWTLPSPEARSRLPAASGRSPVEASKRPSMASPTQSVVPPCSESARSRPLRRSMKPSRAGSSEEPRCCTSCEVLTSWVHLRSRTKSVPKRARRSRSSSGSASGWSWSRATPARSPTASPLSSASTRCSPKCSPKTRTRRWSSCRRAG